MNGIILGDEVLKTTGDYTFRGVVRAFVVKGSGEVRYVVEDDRGLLLILNRNQISLVRKMDDLQRER